MTNIGLFLIETLFDLYVFIIILRMLLQLIHADYRNPLAQFSIKFTQPLLTPLHKFIPHYKNLDLAVVSLAIIFSMLKFITLSLVSFYQFPNIGMVFLLSIIDIVQKIIMLYFYAIIARVIMSWLAPMQQSPILFIINRLVEPLLRPIRKIVPLIAGLDLSPLVALILLKVVSMLFLNIVSDLMRML
jgi:YggT family protein